MFTSGDKVMINDPFCKGLYEIKRIGCIKGMGKQEFAFFTSGSYCRVDKLIMTNGKLIKNCVKVFRKIY